MEDDPFLQPLTKADELLMSVYGDTIHLNDGCQLDGGIEDNKLWLRRWLRVVACDLKLWEVPRRCNLGKRFVNLLANEFKGVRLRQWNSERVIVFAAVILNRRSNVKEAKEIKKVIQQRLDMWEAGQFTALCNEVMKGAESVAPFCTAGDWKEDGVSENVAARYNSMVLSGKIRSAVRFATERGQGGPYSPDDACSKTGRPVIDVLRDKYPKINIPDEDENGKVPGFEEYSHCWVGTPHTSSGEAISDVSKKLHGAAGPGGVDAQQLQSWILRHGTASENLRHELALWSEWLANESPPYAAFCALNAKRAVALDKKPGVRPIGIGEIYMRLWRRKTYFRVLEMMLALRVEVISSALVWSVEWRGACILSEKHGPKRGG